MDWNNPQQRAAFMDLHSDNPREGPGDFASVRRAFAAAARLINKSAGASATGGNAASNDGNSSELRILDLACGPGLQTRHLLELAPHAQITAVDINPPFVDRLNRWAAEHGVSERVSAQVGDMNQLDLAPADLIWCEGAVYMLGVENALRRWRQLLRPNGCIAFTEPVFLSTDLPPAVVENWAEYPPMTDVAGVAARIEAAGYRVVESFVLGDAAWAAYYDPLQLRVDKLKDKYAGDPDGALVIAEGQSEIDAWRNYGEHFSYAFFVVQPDGPEQ